MRQYIAQNGPEKFFGYSDYNKVDVKLSRSLLKMKCHLTHDKICNGDNQLVGNYFNVSN